MRPCSRIVTGATFEHLFGVLLDPFEQVL